MSVCLIWDRMRNESARAPLGFKCRENKRLAFHFKEPNR